VKTKFKEFILLFWGFPFYQPEQDGTKVELKLKLKIEKLVFTVSTDDCTKI